MLKITPSAATAETKLTFSLPVDHPAGQVSVVGNFNDWTPGRHRMQKRNNGTMSVSVTVPADYISNFRYLGENGAWFDEPDADRIDSGASTVWPREAEPVAAKAVKAVKATKKATRKATAKAAETIADVVPDAVTETADKAATKARKVTGKVTEKVAGKTEKVAGKKTGRRAKA